MGPRPAGWQFWIDRGGTFTDIVAVSPEGRVEALKLLSEAPGQYADAGLAGIRRFLGLAPDAPIPADSIDAISRSGSSISVEAGIHEAARAVRISRA